MGYLRFVAFAVGVRAVTLCSVAWAAPPGAVDARVINTAAEPVPVVQQGTAAVVGDVSIVNTPSVNAQQVGPWSVSGEVTVTNAPSQAIPVAPQGTVQVSGGVHVTNRPTVDIGNVPGVHVVGGVPATQSGTWNVGIVGTPTVTLSSATPLQISAVDEPARSAVQGRFTLETFTDGSDSVGFIYDVPYGKRLVVENVSMFAVLPTGQRLVRPLQVGTMFGGMQHLSYFPAFQVEPSEYYVESKYVRIYTDQLLYFYLNRDSAWGQAFGWITFSGYLVDCQAVPCS